ncbi:diguanylate cyclase [Anoxybacillus suryakundensis]|uniref:Diguanylate cyclase (GGDEF) domain n=1 Tax=Anoxybacillus suryakundensis TaxID=1325335 RepID=A0A0K6GLP2_9BACL|nr:diguanylate cyclase [Anoxybacillus suryakundensis]CUA79441.1 diguanylate cyclase (GGDEF) domain [Anoxybacillus suryakundensis]
MIKQFIANSGILIAGFYLISKFFPLNIHKQSPFYMRLLAGAFCGLLSIVLMLFSIPLGHGVIADLRHIPLIVVSYYGGMPSALAAGIIMGAGRFLFGNMFASLVSFFISLAIAIGCGLISRWMKRNIAVTTFWMNVYSMCFISIALFINIPDRYIYTETLVIFWPISIIATYVAANICKDIRQSKDLLQHYKAWATTDFLTGLYNVRQFHTALNEKMAQVKQQNNCLALILFDIDRFKSVNDVYGHDGGDVILRHLGELIRSLVPKNGLAFRNGGEEFSILLISCEHEAVTFAEHVRTTIERYPFVVQKQTVHITVSIGISLFPTLATNETELFKQADIALYEAKQQGRNRTVVYKGTLA